MIPTAQPVYPGSVSDFMRDASSYPDRPKSVDVIETHISYVYLTDGYAYKLKKPVRFEFLDFSTPELRHRACLDEVRLNRRLTPNLYVGVLPITRSSSRELELNGDGDPIDWVVQMRRLSANDALDVVIREGRLTPAHSQSVARLLSHFYARMLPKPIGPDVYHEALERHIRGNRKTLLNLLPTEELRSRVRRVQSSQLRYLKIESDLIGCRATAGRIFEGHGDLRPEHIYLNDHPTVIDCIEFSEDLRTIDVADELSFLGMECRRLGDGGLGDSVLEEYEKMSGDHVPESLLNFYRSYRASVRAKVALLRGQQHVGSTADACDDLVRNYIDLAEHYAKQLGPPILLIVGGLMGSGKSTLAEKLAEALAIEVLSTDHIRRRLIGSSEAPTGNGEGNYRPDMRGRVYDELFRLVSEQLREGYSVVLDGTFLTCCLRDRAYALGARNGAVCMHVQCTCPRAIAYARIQKRAEAGLSESEARTELYDLQARDFEPPWADESAVIVDTTQPMTQQMQSVFKGLRCQLMQSN